MLQATIAHSRRLSNFNLVRPPITASSSLTIKSHQMTFFSFFGKKNQSTVADNTSELEQNIVAETSSYDVVIYSKSYCPYCTSTKQLFSTKFPNVTTKIIELDNISNGSAIQSTLAKMTGQRTVPNVWVKGNFVGGNDDTQGLHRSGKLSEMLQ